MFLGWDWGFFQVEDDLQTLIFWGFPLESDLEVNNLKKSFSCCGDDGNSGYADVSQNDCGDSDSDDALRMQLSLFIGMIRVA